MKAGDWPSLFRQELGKMFCNIFAQAIVFISKLSAYSVAADEI